MEIVDLSDAELSQVMEDYEQALKKERFELGYVLAFMHESPVSVEYALRVQGKIGLKLKRERILAIFEEWVGSGYAVRDGTNYAATEKLTMALGSLGITQDSIAKLAVSK